MDDVQLLATILQGEAAVLGPAGMTAVAAVFVARLLSPSFPDTVPAVATAFYGSSPPGLTAQAIAADALTDPAAFLADYYLTNHSVETLYCFSAQDRRRLNLPPGDQQLIRSHTWQLHLYKEDPLEHRNPLPPAPAGSHLPARIHHTRQGAWR